jgi:hypothetical protein
MPLYLYAHFGPHNLVEKPVRFFGCAQSCCLPPVRSIPDMTMLEYHATGIQTVPSDRASSGFADCETFAQ